MLITGLNPYGLTYTLGLQGQGTPRANPSGSGLEGFLRIALSLNPRSIELHAPWLHSFRDEEFPPLRDRLYLSGLNPIISLGPPLENVDLALRSSVALGSKILRLGLSPVLCGDRAVEGQRWKEMIKHARETLNRFAPLAADQGITIAIENHQDFGSEELIELASSAGSNVGITLDTGNPLAVAEDILGFSRRVAPLVRHVHLKDYTPQWTDQGYRLVRCAIGDGCVPFQSIVEILGPHSPELTASLEPAALEARHIRLFQPEWWRGYPSRTAAELGPCLEAARIARLPDEADYRTPWEKAEPPEAIIDYELAMIRRSASNMRSIGLM